MPRARKTTTPTEGQYAGDLVSNAGKREMGPKCGSLPRNASEEAVVSGKIDDAHVISPLHDRSISQISVG